MIKALFFDIDGTLVSFKTHEIPVSTIEALTAAKAKGIHIFILPDVRASSSTTCPPCRNGI